MWFSLIMQKMGSFNLVRGAPCLAWFELLYLSSCCQKGYWPSCCRTHIPCNYLFARDCLFCLSSLNFLFEVIELPYISHSWILQFLEDEYTFYEQGTFWNFWLNWINFLFFAIFAYWLYFWQRRQIQRICDWLQ